MIYANQRLIRQISAVIGLWLCGAGSVPAEDPKLTFEVAAIRPSAPGTRSMLRGGPGTPDLALIDWSNCSLDFLIERAYGIQPDQFSGPGWLSSAPFDISARVPPGTTPDQFDAMLRNLLAERFHLEVHHEARLVDAYDLVLGKGPLRLKASEWVPPSRPDPVPGRQYLDAPIFSTGRVGERVVTGRGAHISDLVRFLRVAMHRRVEDRTELTGRYDFTFPYSSSMNAGSTAPYIVDALRQELGLDLKATRILLDGLVVDRVDKTPTEN
jgi:uncharacterized protein (TIGR03435 family)